MFVLLILDLCTLHLCILRCSSVVGEVGELMSEAAELQTGVCGTNLLLLVLPLLPCALSVNLWSEM